MSAGDGTSKSDIAASFEGNLGFGSSRRDYIDSSNRCSSRKGNLPGVFPALKTSVTVVLASSLRSPRVFACLPSEMPL